MPSSHTSSAVIPADAASLVILRGSADAPEVLLGQRRETARFMPGYFVFPGGAVDPADRDLAAGSWAGTRFHACAARETWEETGVLIAGEGMLPAEIGAEDPFYTLLRQAGRQPKPEAVHYIARAITPPPSPIRFDTRFFLTHEAETEGEARAVGELPKVLWVPVDQALASDSVRGVTKFVLGEALTLWRAPEKLDDPDRSIRRYAYIDGGRQVLIESQAEGLA